MKIIAWVLGLVMSLTATPAFAQWAAPTSTPPGGNTATPINVGTTLQVKNGGLSVNAFSAFANSYFSSSVGVGTTSPSAKLSVTGSGTGTGRAFVIANSSNAEKVTVLDNGSVGIGTTSPQAKFHVSGNALVGGDPMGVLDATFTVKGDFAVAEATEPAPYGRYKMSVDDTGGWAYVSQIMGRDIDIWKWYANNVISMELKSSKDDAGNPTYLALNNQSGTTKNYFSVNGSSYFNGGNLGIGTTVPGDKLTVKGTSRIESAGVTNPIDYRWLVTGPTADYDTLYLTGESATGNETFGTGNGNGNQIMSFKAKGENEVGIGYDAGATAHTAKLSVNGNVGIGNIAPTAGLTVGDDISVGNAKAVAFGNTSGNFYQYTGQDSTHNLAMGWTYSATPSSAFATIQTFSRANPLYVDGSQLYLNTLASAGNVGVGTTLPGYKLEVNGSIGAVSFFYTSDKSLKKNIKPLTGSLDKITKLQGVSFDWKKDNTPSVGLIAQDVEKVYPELVNTNPESGIKSVEYGNLVAPLIEAVKEQQKQINDQGKLIERQQKEIYELKTLIQSR